jgi:excisionase family DNA binding protein
MPTDEQRLLVEDGLETISGVVRFTKLSRSAVYELMGTGRLAYVKLGRARRVPRRSLVELVAAALQVDADR